MSRPAPENGQVAPPLQAPDPALAALQKYRSASRAMGLTRLAPVTGLDRTGIPVAAAYRPNAPSVCVNHGKGLTPDGAKASALGEALELWHAETPDLNVIEASPVVLRTQRRCAPLYDLPRRVGSEIDDDAPLAWIQGEGLYDAGPVMVPLASVCMDLTLPAFPGSQQFAASTSGLGTGLTRTDAVLHALCEVVERDAHALWLLRGNDLSDVNPVDAGAATGPNARQVIERLEAAGLTVGLADITGDVRLPTILAVLIERAGRNPNETPFALGTACHPHPETAIVKALTEAAQMRLLQITALRDDLSGADYHDRNSRIWDVASQAIAKAPKPFSATPGAALADPDAALSFALDALKAANTAQPILVDLTKRALSIPVVKILIPGFEDGLDLATHRLGQRGLQARLDST